MDRRNELIYDDILKDGNHLKAVWYRFGQKKVWIPKSQILREDLVKQTVTVPEWLMKENHLEMYSL